MSRAKGVRLTCSSTFINTTSVQYFTDNVFTGITGRCINNRNSDLVPNFNAFGYLPGKANLGKTCVVGRCPPSQTLNSARRIPSRTLGEVRGVPSRYNWILRFVQMYKFKNAKFRIGSQIHLNFYNMFTHFC